MTGRTISEKILSAKAGHDARAGDMLTVTDAGKMTVRNESTGETLSPEPLPQIMLSILAAGGLVLYMRQYGGFAI